MTKRFPRLILAIVFFAVAVWDIGMSYTFSDNVLRFICFHAGLCAIFAGVVTLGSYFYSKDGN